MADKSTINRESGFTFLELLLVLSIVMVLTAVILPFSEKRLQKVSEEDALQQFIAAVHEAQLYAITHQRIIIVETVDNGDAYKVKEDGLPDLFSGRFPDGMQRTKNSPIRRLEFSPNGYLKKTGNMYFHTQSKGQIKISFQFERGRMKIHE